MLKAIIKMTQQTRGNLWISDVKTYFLGLHLKNRDIQSFVIRESDLPAKICRILSRRPFFSGFHLTFRKYGSQNFNRLISSISLDRFEKRLSTTVLAYCACTDPIFCNVRNTPTFRTKTREEVLDLTLVNQCAWGRS